MRSLGPVLGTLAAVALALGTHAGAYAANVTGTAGDDVLHGTSSADTIKARAGNDTVHGGAGADKIYGDRGKDTLYGGKGADDIEDATSPAPDRIFGGTGGDLILTNYKDQVKAGSGNDTIDAFYPDKSMVIDCGSGDDHVTFNQKHPGVTLLHCEHVKIVPAG